MVNQARSRSPAGRDDRRDQLLATVRALFDEHGLEFSMQDVGRAAGLAKGTAYFYFRTKEEILLGLLTAELDAWFDAIGPKLAGSGPVGPSELADLLADSFGSRSRLLRLMAVQASVLERNLSDEAALAFKRFTLERAAQLAPRLETRFPGLNGLSFLQTLTALVIGFAQLAFPAPAVRRALEHPELRVLHLTFEPALRHALLAHLVGLTQTASGASEESLEEVP